METKNEIWKDIEGYEGYYQVSNLGRVKSVDRVVEQDLPHGLHGTITYRGKILKNQTQRNGYMYIGLHKNNIYSWFRIHRLVAMTFVPGYKEGMEVNHIDENKRNNRADNLEWVSRRENLIKCSTLEKWNNVQSRAVLQMSCDNKTINRFDSVTQASVHTGVERRLISAACHKRNKSAGGYRWKFADK